MHQHINGQESPLLTVPAIFQKKPRIQGKKHDFFHPKAERLRPNDPEPVGLGEIITQEPERVVNTHRISSPNNRNITPTQNEHNVITPEINLNSNSLWLKMYKFPEKTQKQFSEVQKSHEKMEKLTASMDQIVQTLQEGHDQLRKASK
ncbi:hypothetical protein O181_012682 [Austropuccinia psidii MF-1]|uniref:Uncharacterized protein n=1 Tax=Austropuccinia psidii MF-1 TaxID=1389203 RepID=A0A9Q3BY58_9BASI|nr:hypothetical protein [Austropuccinia psidii MF-1]